MHSIFKVVNPLTLQVFFFDSFSGFFLSDKNIYYGCFCIFCRLCSNVIIQFLGLENHLLKKLSLENGVFRLFLKFDEYFEEENFILSMEN